MFDKLLVANRGEIALRVLRTAREMGIRTATVYSEQDSRSLHIKHADEAFYLGDGTPKETYLDIERLASIASENGCDAVHPGYGFLSENAAFVRALEQSSVTFVGPSAEAMEAMGNKVAAKQTMAEHKVPVTPGAIRPIRDEDEALRLAKDVGYPVLVKAAAGGGGMGILLALDEKELPRILAAAKAVADSAFGDDSVFIEKFLTRPRHIEVQVLADAHGDIVHYGERECSIQRRYQKLIEEAPSPAIDEKQRQEMGDVAIAAAKAVDYTNAGTVEMIWSEGSFYFNEMNTRLQVEHPVTEFVYGVDLVREQLRVASGEPLGYDQSSIKPNGWAIECRINAEDPYRDFLPTPGTVANYLAPSGIGVRVDSHLYSGYEIPSAYDSLIAKLVTWGRDRAESIGRMARALREYEIEGVRSTLPFHRVVMRDEMFVAGDLSTDFVKERQILDQMLEVKAIERAENTQLAVALVAALEAQPGGATEYARRHARLAAGPARFVPAQDATSPWMKAARIEALREGG